MIALDVMVEAGDWGRLDSAEALAQQAAEAAVEVADRAKDDTEVTVMLTDDGHIRGLNKAWRGKDQATNVLSFPAPDHPATSQPAHGGPRHLGDIALAYDTLAREAEEEAKAFADHFAHLVVHGVLHLLGYDHETDAEAEVMESLEIRALSTLGISDPYRDMAA